MEDFKNHPRLRREARTIKAMVRIYCRDHHGTREGICSECQKLLDYAHARLKKCTFGEAKPTCAKCPIHCYGPEMREKVKSVMRYAGPRMLLRHPILALMHLLDGRREPVPRARRQPGQSQ